MMDYSMLAQDRMQEALRQAERERLVRQAEQARAGRPWHARLLTALGAWLTARGCELQARFGQPKVAARITEATGRMAAR